MNLGFRRVLLCALVAALSGCAAVRYADYRMPSLRLDPPTNKPLPERDDPRVDEALRKWAELKDGERRAFPTPYHVYVDTPDIAADPGERAIGLAFSGGGTRGILFGAACVREMSARGLQPLLDEVDYVSGVSTGAVPATFFALNYGPHGPESFRFDRWPECFNVDVVRYTLGSLARRPDWVARGFTFDMNARQAMVAAMATLYFKGTRYDMRSGLTFAHLPRTPVLVLGATVIQDPAAPFVQTRLPYRYALDEYPEVPWGVAAQSFESFRTDPMAYSLAEACYNSISYPGTMRSGRVEVLADPAWVLEGLEGAAAARMERSRTQPGYHGVYDLKDGGLTDNRGLFLLGRLLEKTPLEARQSRRPLLIGIDASQLALRTPEPGEGIVGRGWFDEFAASTTASWQTGQDAYQRLLERTSAEGAYDLVHLRFGAWLPYLPVAGRPASPESQYLEALCRAEPRVGTPEALLDITRGIGTHFTAVSETQLAAIVLCARFAVWHEGDRLDAEAAGL